MPVSYIYVWKSWICLLSGLGRQPNGLRDGLGCPWDGLGRLRDGLGRLWYRFRILWSWLFGEDFVITRWFISSWFDFVVTYMNFCTYTNLNIVPGRRRSTISISATLETIHFGFSSLNIFEKQYLQSLDTVSVACVKFVCEFFLLF